MKKSLLLFVLLATFSLHAKLEDHFKPVHGKTSKSKMKNIDFIYMINLDQRPDKWQMSSEQLNRYGIYPYRFSAVCGWDLTLKDINDVGVKYAPWMDGGFKATSFLTPDLKQINTTISKYGQTYFVHCCSRGVIGIALSHLSILQDAYDSGYETIWVMEDDIEVCQDPRKIPELIEKLDKIVGRGNWDILFTDRDYKNREGQYVPSTSYARRPNFWPRNPERFAVRQEITQDFRRVGAKFGATSMIIRRSGMKKLLEFFKHHNIYLPYDIDYAAPNDIRLYTVNKDVIGNMPGAPSNNARGPKKLEETPDA